MTGFDLFGNNLHLPKRLANFESFTHSCAENSHYDDFPVGTLYCTKKSHHVVKESQCSCKLCVKDTPASLKTECVNKISEFTFYPIPKLFDRVKTKKKLKNFHVFNRGASKLLWFTKKPHSAN